MTNPGPESYDVSGCFHVRLPSSTQIVHLELHPNIIDSGGRWKMAFSPGAFITRSQGLRVAMVAMDGNGRHGGEKNSLCGRFGLCHSTN